MRKKHTYTHVHTHVHTQDGEKLRAAIGMARYCTVPYRKRCCCIGTTAGVFGLDAVNPGSNAPACTTVLSLLDACVLCLGIVITNVVSGISD